MEELLSAGKIRLRRVEEGDYLVLFAWRNNAKFLSHFSAHRTPVSYEQFLAEFKRESKKDRHLQFIVELVSDIRPIGIIYTFNYNRTDGYVFLNTFIIEEFETVGHGAVATIILLFYLFDFIPSLHKIYFDVFEYNTLSMSTLRNAGFDEEGRFKGHRLQGTSRYDVLRFAAYRNNLDRLRSIWNRLRKI